MNLLILGLGKTGSLVAEVARERHHNVHGFDEPENANARGLTLEFLNGMDIVIDFTTPSAAVINAEACIRAKKNIVIGTTGWYDQIPRLRELVLSTKTALLYGSNFSIGVNLFFEIAKTASAALAHDYTAKISETHHVHKKDAPSGTAITLGKILREMNSADIEIDSFREGDVVGVHEIILDSPNDCITLLHDAKSRRGFADGAVRAAEWLVGKQGFFEFRDIWKEL